MRPPATLAVLALILFLNAPDILLNTARAEPLNRDQPVNIDADKVTVDDRNKVHVFEGNVVLTQGTLTLRGSRLVITQNAAGFHNGVVTAAAGQLATFRQKRTGGDSWVEGEAERIEYNTQSERARLFNRARIQNGGDKVSGQYIEYDTVSENYLVTDSPERARDEPAKARVHVTIQPKNDK